METNFKPNPNAEPYGSAFFGAVVAITAAQIAAKFGRAHCSGDKVDHEWIFEADDGDVVTLYDWKVYGEPADEFHVGGRNSASTERFARWFSRQ